MNSKTVFQIGMAIIVLIFMVACAGYSTREPVPGDQGKEQKGGFIEKFDQNKDGKVIREEFPGPDHVFERFDQNEDGVIDAGEAPQSGGPSS